VVSFSLGSSSSKWETLDNRILRKITKLSLLWLLSHLYLNSAEWIVFVIWSHHTLKARAYTRSDKLQMTSKSSREWDMLRMQTFQANIPNRLVAQDSAFVSQ
jgi:hypothetical protein